MEWQRGFEHCSHEIPIFLASFHLLTFFFKKKNNFWVSSSPWLSVLFRFVLRISHRLCVTVRHGASTMTSSSWLTIGIAGDIDDSEMYIYIIIYIIICIYIHTYALLLYFALFLLK
jgi:hypothetical protein